MIRNNPKFFESTVTLNSTRLIFDRESNLPMAEFQIQRRLRASSAYVDALEKETLVGHEGCVNCLEWSESGQFLASGSDDLKVIIWDAFRKKQVHTIRTKHEGNIFSVKFLPRHSENLIATGAADKHIYVYDVNRDNEFLVCCNCHRGRVKRLATSPDSPFIFWSAGEDGVILQIDIREPHRCPEEKNRILNLTTCVAGSAEAKCLAINKYLLAVGANDPYARLYDRRMLHTHRDSRDNIPEDCVTYFSPGHINKNNSKVIEHEHRAITYLTFNAIGTELLVNTGGEHIYLYDLQNAEQPTFLNLPEYRPSYSSGAFKENESVSQHLNSSSEYETTSTTTSTTAGGGLGGTTSTSSSSPTSSTNVHRRKLPEHIEIYKKIGNDLLENEKYLHAINQYSQAISLAPECPVLYLNRATAYMRRQWFGDVYAALRDCHAALRIDPTYTKAHFRLARALLELERPSEADECLQELLNRFPSYATNHGVLMLHKDIKERSQAANSQPQLQQQQQQQHSETYDHHMEYTDSECLWRSKAKDYSKRFVGHCNTTTDIKEANFFGYDGDFIVAGSDDGNLFIWDRNTMNVRSIYKGDSAIVNCVQPHPTHPTIATSGIDHDIKLWSPIAPSPLSRPHLITYVDKCIEENQQKMKTDPFDLNTRAFCWNG